MAQNIEIPVSLGLLNALSQVADLRKMLLDSVNVKSDAFKDILRFLDKISGLADALKGKMGEAFKTPSGSKNFLKQYEQLMGMLEAARDKFTNLGLNDIAFSADDQASVDKTIEKIKSLQAEIANLEKGKIGNLFDDKSILGADKVTAFIEQLKSTGQDVSKITFSGLSTAINRELSVVNTKIQETTERISGFKALINTLSGTSLDNITTKMEQALTSATDPAKSTFKTEKLIEYRNAVADFYKEWDLLGVLHNAKNDTTGNVSTWLLKESLNIANGAENLKALLPKCLAALLLLQEIKDNPALKGDEAKGKVLNIAESLGLTNFNADSFRSYTSAIAELRRKILEELMHGFTSDKEVDQYAEQMIAHLGQAFENIDINKVVNVTNLRNLLKAIFTEAGLDLRDSDLSRIINSLGENMDFSAFISNAQQAFLDFIKKRQEMVDESEKQNKTLKQLQTDLQTASNTVQTLDNIKTDSIKLKEAEIQQFTLSLQELINKYNEANGTHLKVVDDSLFKNGLSAITSYIDSLTKLQLKQKALSNVQMAVNRWMGFWQVLNMAKSAINDMKKHVQELDSVMTSISVVTNFSQEDLWGQISQYSEIARQYGVAIKGVYEVSQIYYQLGLQLNDVMTLTTETLKMARIAGLDYATAADYMTTAIRGFKLEMTDAAHVTDVFSALAATTASSTEEIATAISKTAASAEAVGASFEATSAMMATMIATTRESATNIGTALKSVISRYGEMTSDPSKTVDSEGEEMSLNRVDKALLTVGITIHDTAGLFRDFDDVMLELMEKWDSLDSLSLRYIATLMAGNRQQSRFLALVSNVDEYKKALETAMDSEGTGELLTLKTLDSIDAKIEKMKVTILEFYTSSGIEELYKDILDSITNIVSAANSLPKAFGKIPVAAIAMGASIISAVKSAILVILGEILAGLEMMKGNTLSTMTGLISMMAQGGRQSGEAYRKEQEAAMNGSTAGKHGLSKGAVIGGMVLRYAGAALSIAGTSLTLLGMNAYGASLTHDEDQAAANQVRTGGILGILGSTASGAAMGATYGPYGAIIGGAIGGIKGLVENIATLTSANEMYNVSVAREIELSSKRLEAAKQDLLEAKNTEKSLEQAYTKLKELEEHLYDSVEAQLEYHDYMNLLADSYPAYVEKIDLANNAIIYSGTLEEELAKARELSASATTAAIEAELNKADWQETSVNNFRNGLQGLYSEGLTTDNSNLTGLAQVVRRAVGTDINLPTNLNYRALFEEGTMTEEQAAEYLVKSYLSRYSNVELDHYNRRTGLTDMSPFGTRYTYKGLLNQTVGNSDKSLLELIMTDSNLGAERDAIRYSRSLFEELLTNLTEEAQKAGQSISLETITKNKNIKNVSDIYNLTDKEFLAAIAEAKTWADLTATATEATKLGIETALVSAKTREKVTALINTLENKLDKSLAEQYENLIAYGLSAKFGQDIDKIDSKLFDEAFINLSDWIKNNQESAEALANIDYSLYISFEKLKDSIKNFGDLDDKIESQIETDFNEARTNAITLYTNLLTGIFGDGKAPSWLTDTDQFTNRTLTAIQSDLKQYLSLIEKQQYAQAEAYLNSMEAIYGPEGIGSLSGEELTKAFDVIKDLDLSDPEQLRVAAETLTNMGGNFEKIASQFTGTASRWAASAATLLEQLSSSTKDTAKSIESSTSDMSKVFKYSEALEKAQALMDANEGVQFDELFTFDKDLGGYIKTAKAFSLEMAEFLKTSYDAVLQSITDNQTILPLIDSVNNTIRDLYLTDIKNESITGDRSRYAKLQFEQRLKTIQPEASDADLDRLWSEYTAMIDAFEAQSEDGKEDWNTFTQKYLKEHGSDLVKQLEEILKMPLSMAQEALLSFDYASIASGKGTTLVKETLKGLLMAAAPLYATHIDHFFEDYYQKLITGNFEEYNTYLERLGLSNLKVTEGEANRARFEGLTSLYEKIASGDIVWDALTEQEQELLNSVEGINLTEGASAALVGAAADNVWAAIIKLILVGAGTLNEVADTIAGKADKAFKNSNTGKQYNLLTSYKDGFTSSEALELGLLNDDGTLKAEFASYLERDSNGNWVAAAGQNAASVILNLARLLNISIDKTTDEYKDAIKDGIDQAITEADKADIGKQRVNAWQSIMSGKVSDRISLADVDATTRSYMKAAGLISDMNADFVYILSEELLNNAIEWMRTKLANTSFIEHNQLTARYFQQLVSDFEAKTAKNAAFEGVISEQFNQSAAEALSMALLNTTEYSEVQSLMNKMGFQWDLAALVWKATNESIKAARAKINTAYGTGQIDREEFLHLQASLDATAKAIDPKTKLDNALLEILQNYNAITDEMLATFATEFHISHNSIKNFIKANDNGTYDIDLGALTSYLNSIGFAYDEAAKSEIEAITDSYLSNIQTATAYSTLGASSLADVEAFRLSYADIVHESLDADAFQYDSLTLSFVLDPATMHKYIDALKQILTGMGYTEEFVNAYITDLTDKAILAGIELDSFLNADTSRARNDEANKLILLIRGLSNYAKIATSAFGSYDKQYKALLGKTIEEIQVIEALTILNVLESGGQAAADLLKQIKPDASADELSSVYSSAINRLNDALSDAGEFVKGSMINTTSKLYLVLRTLNPEGVNADGVITATYDMVAVYKAIYAEMSHTAGATTAGLNDAFAQLLTAQDLINIDITDTLKNGAGMSYADFGSLLAKYDIKLEDYMREHMDTIMRDGFGNIRITNWDKFALNIWGDNLDSVKNTPEYMSAFKAYNDGLIELNKTTELTIVDEIKLIENAKPGDQLNLSYLWTALLNVIDQAAKNIIPENYRGNVDLANRPIISAKEMKTVFSDFEDDYATLYSKSFMSLDFEDYTKNVGMLFTTITASGEIVEDLYSYVKALYDEANGDVNLMREYDRVGNGGKGLMLFGEMSSSYEHLAEVADDYHIRAADKDTINYYLKALQAVGANYVDGILTISEDADMIAISDILSILSDLSGVDLGEEGRAAIEEAVDNLLENIASLISNGINGSLTKSDAASLSLWYRATVKDYTGATIAELDFSKTTDGLKLTETSLANVYDLMKRIDSIKADALLDDIISSRESFLSLTGALREFNDAMRLDGIDETTNKLKNFNGTLSNTARMMQDVVLKTMTSPDAMNFMSNKLPDDMQAAVNAWENASKAIKTITASEKSGYMGVQDFYNIVNTASSLMTAAGKDFSVAGKDAATLLQQGAQNLKVVDGQLTVDISSAGLNIVGSADLLKQNMATGINELADAEIAIIDAEIEVLEILATMEQMGDMDVDIDNDGLTFEIGDIFKDDGNFTNIDDGVNNMTDYLAKLKELVDKSDETIAAFENFKINGTSLYKLLDANADVWRQVFGSEENVSKFMQKFTKGIKGWDLEGNLQEQVLEFMKGLGEDYSINLGDSGVFHVSASGVTYVIDFSDKERMKAAKEAAQKFSLDVGKTDQEFLDYLKALVEKGKTQGGKTSELTFKENLVLKVATGLIEIVYNKKTNQNEYKVGGRLYKNASVANAVAELIQAGATADWEDLQKREVDVSTDEPIKGTMTVGTVEIEVDSDGKGNLTYKTTDGNHKGKSLDELYTNWFKEETGKEREGAGLEFKKWQVKKGISLEPVFEVDNKEGNTKTNEKLRDSIEDAIENGITEVHTTDKAYEVPLKGGVNLTIPKVKIDKKDGLTLNEAILEYLIDNNNTIDLDLKDTVAKAITEAFEKLPEAIKALNEIDTQGISKVANAINEIYTNANNTYEKIAELITQITNLAESLSQEMELKIKVPEEPERGSNNEDGTPKERSTGASKSATELQTVDMVANITSVTPDPVEILALANVSEVKVPENTSMPVKAEITSPEEAETTFKGTINYEPNVIEPEDLTRQGSIEWSPTSGFYPNAFRATGTIEWSGGGGGTFNTKEKVPKIPTKGTKLAEGNVGLAKSKGTLMGELGPELVVSNGRYFVAGQNGAEMVDLADDAIVFNHLQTEQLLKKGMSNSRGKAVTSEKNAVAFATGNTGPAMAGATAVLAMLQQLRAMWESLKKASISDLAGAAGGGGGGGGGGDNGKIIDPKAWVDTVERWYNLMQKIARLEKEITHEETLRSKLLSDWNANGTQYYASHKRSLEALRDEVATQELLNLSREAYYDQRVEALRNSAFGKFIDFDNQGLMRFQPGMMQTLADLVGTSLNPLGKANHTNKEKYDLMISYGLGEYMKYDSNGMEIKADEDNDGEVTEEELESFYERATSAGWERLNSEQAEMQGIWDSIKEGEDTVLQLQTDENEILEEIRNNQMELEQSVLDAIVDMREREIDALLEERDKLLESTEKYINGLSDALDKERLMYDNLEAEDSLNLQKRRLAILLRSGGSAQDIANLRSEIDSAERDMYFNLLQQQIDAIQEASDLEIERMDHQIEIMTETLEYLKEYGLLWANVYDIMSLSSDKITSFITNGNSKFWASSPLSTADKINKTLFAALLWKAYQDDVSTIALRTQAEIRERDYKIFDEAMRAEFGEDYDANGEYSTLFYSVYDETGDLTKADAAARAKYAEDKRAEEAARRAAEEAAQPPQEVETVPEPTETYDGGGNTNNNNNDLLNSLKLQYNVKIDGMGAVNLTASSPVEAALKAGADATPGYGYTVTYANNQKTMRVEETDSTRTTTYTDKKKNTTVKVTRAKGGKSIGNKASGGYVNHGIYELGELGTETVLTASQTKVLRDNILSNRPNSLVSLLKSYNEGYDGINNSVNGVTPIEDNSTNIDKIELKMEVKQIANDYDARRAGEQALNEMMRIARKTGVTNGIRR